MSLANQFQTMGWMVCSGLGLGILFDVYRVFAKHMKFAKWMISCMDCLFGLLAALAVFRVLFMSNQGQLRLFVFIGLFIGIFLYYKWFSFSILKCIEWLFLAVKWFMAVFLIIPIQKIVIFLKAVTIFFSKIMLQLIYPFWHLISYVYRWVKRWVLRRFHKF